MATLQGDACALAALGALASNVGVSRAHFAWFKRPEDLDYIAPMLTSQVGALPTEEIARARLRLTRGGPRSAIQLVASLLHGSYVTNKHTEHTVTQTHTKLLLRMNPLIIYM